MSLRRFCCQRWLKGLRPRAPLMFHRPPPRRNLCCSSTLLPLAHNTFETCQKHHYTVYCSSRKRSFHRFSLPNDECYERYRHLTNDIVELIQHENERTRQCIDQTLKEEIAQEILDIYNTVSSQQVPELGPTGMYQYSTTDDVDGQRRYYRQHVESGEKQVLLDIDFRKYQLHALSLSVNEAFVAYLVSPVASPSQTLVKIRHVDSGREVLLPTEDWTVANVEWGPLEQDGSDSLFFTTSNEKGRPCAVYGCSVRADGEISPLPQCLYQNDDEAVMVDVQRTKGCKYMALYASTKTSSEIYLIQHIENGLILVRPRQEDVLYHIDVGNKDDVFLLAHAAEPNHESGLSEEMTLFEATVASLPLQSTFGAQLADSDDEYIVADMDVFESFVALYERSKFNGQYRICIQIRSVSTPGDAGTIVPFTFDAGDCAILSSAGNMCYTSKCFRFRVESPSTPGTTYSYDTTKGDIQLLGSKVLLPSYVEERVFVTSADGTEVPVSLVYSDSGSGSNDSRRPAVLIGYGSYGEPAYHGFDPTILPLLNRGFVIAYAHTRGGGDLGRAWYRAGRLYEKDRTVEDFIACAEGLAGHLGITDSRGLTAKAFSAGGVTVAAAVNRQPELFGCLVLTNAFLDVTNSMMNTNLALTEHERSEWGDPLCDAKAAKTIASYCPMGNIAPQVYPKMLLIGAIDDAHVPYWHPLTFCLKVRRSLEFYQHCTTMLPSRTVSEQVERHNLLHIESSGGHQLHRAKLDLAATEIGFIIQCQQNYS